MSADIDEADEAAEWAVRKLKKARTKTTARESTANDPFPSVAITKTGAWIKDQYERVEDELHRAEGAERRSRPRGRSGFGSHYDETYRRLAREDSDRFVAWHQRMSRLLNHVQVLAESLSDDDEVALSVAEVAKLRTSMTGEYDE